MSQYPPPTSTHDTVTFSTGRRFALHRRIWVTFQRKGFHRYPDAPEAVDYLSSRHRHVFKFKVMVDVHHNERDLEFHMFQTALENLYDSGTLEADNQSCETMAYELINQVLMLYPQVTNAAVEVSEDGECGSIITMQEITPNLALVQARAEAYTEQFAREDSTKDVIKGEPNASAD